MTDQTTPKQQAPRAEAAGLSGASPRAEEQLRATGIDPRRLSIFRLGRPTHDLVHAVPHWARRMLLGYVLWVTVSVLEHLQVALPSGLGAALSLITGLVILNSACEVVVIATERFAARLRWDAYAAGTLAEILSTIPEFVVIAFLVPVSPQTAFVIALITIYNNALAFSLYSFFLPKDQAGNYLMPKPITDAGTQILIGGAAMGFILGLVLLVFEASDHPKRSFEAGELIALSVLLFTIFGVYLYKLLKSYASEEEEVRETLGLTEEQLAGRKDLVYESVAESPLSRIVWLFLLGVVGSFFGGERVAAFAGESITGLGLNPVLAALILAAFAGMSEYVILWRAHRNRQYRIALANAFGGITQLMYLVLPFTLLCLGIYQGLINPAHPELPIHFTLANILLLIFLFPTFFVLVELLEKDHTLDILDTAIMVGIFLLLIVLLVVYGGNGGGVGG
jgi:sodium/calcium exchanger protein